ncbi:hypothetical protein CAOG_01860 [Capsaspora owczarzaki ATCC 30864]|uniref:Uncharacterized protein n=1 Tax=Capsaspora owczarzaki (strain ATCC 30864) TaxID=595528 RepID=A0A0D2VKK9_CAPO3|nr:hypothetical protein CAOG_01860 [Capsaspora owczarzaki ATCC 30864]KJE90557.1 hypothetical protein CAOG_001860 [Capsaspora owczarzaki ATCC 30864]|eukprot:XP_004364728.1 hypothetical protein CAOG_01860 [Capsaspora owczarzaki ATCC 30864]
MKRHHHQAAAAQASSGSAFAERDELFRRSAASDGSAHGASSSSSSSTSSRPGETAITMMEYGAREHGKLAQVDSSIDEMLGNAVNMLDSLKSQRATLKSAHRRALDVFNTLGLSNTVMRYIEKRSAQDWWILTGGMIFTIVFMVMFYRWWMS